MNRFHIYIHFPNNIDNKIASKEDGAEFVTNFQMTIDRADCENGSILYYSKRNKDAFFEELNLFQNDAFYGNFGGYTFEETLNILLDDVTICNWETNPIHDLTEKSCYYRQWDSDSKNHISNYPNVLNEITERDSRDSDQKTEKCIFLNLVNAYPLLNELTMIRHAKRSKPFFFHFDNITDFFKLDKWFLENRKKRVYNFDDFRHIENNPKYIPEKSPLLGGIGGQQNASDLLANAIGDKRERKYQLNFDPKYDKYIRYEDENTGASYHGYHLVKPKTYEVDVKAINESPQRAIKILEYRKKNEEKK